MSDLNLLPRTDKLWIARCIHQRLLARLGTFGPEPALDAFIAPLGELCTRLEVHMGGTNGAHAASGNLLSRLFEADDEVDTWLRHLYNFTAVAGNRRSGVHAAPARALHGTAFPRGLTPVSARISEENAYCRAAITVLRAPEHATTLKGIKLPFSWIDALDDAVSQSSALDAELLKARGDRSGHIRFAQAAETDWVRLMRRLRNHMAGRADASDLLRFQEGQRLLEPLLVELKKQNADASARATRRKTRAASEANPLPQETP